MYLKDQQYMNALALSGSMTKASKMLGISQPALSKWLASLEAQLKTPLFLRSSKHLLLTEAGQIYLHGCQECLNTASEIRRQAKALPPFPNLDHTWRKCDPRSTGVCKDFSGFSQALSGD